MDSETPKTPSTADIRARLLKMPPAEWVRRMVEHHRRTGTYRTQDLRRLLGDPNKRVDNRPETLQAALQARSQGEAG